LEEFDELLLNVIDCAIEDILGKINSNALYDYLEKEGCPRHEIPRKPEIFSMKMRNILGHDRGQILGAASILEKAILRAFCTKLKTEFNQGSDASFAHYITNLREVYSNKKQPNRKV
jgi:hypothetical protein